MTTGFEESWNAEIESRETGTDAEIAGIEMTDGEDKENFWEVGTELSTVGVEMSNDIGRDDRGHRSWCTN